MAENLNVTGEREGSGVAGMKREEVEQYRGKDCTIYWDEPEGAYFTGEGAMQGIVVLDEYPETYEQIPPDTLCVDWGYGIKIEAIKRIEVIA